MDSSYLKNQLGTCLTVCLAEVAEKRPRDPVEYIAQWLYKYTENQNYAAQKIKEAEQLEEEKKNFVKEQELKEKRKIEAEQIAKEDAERKKAEAERALKESSSTKLPPVIEAQEPSEEAPKIKEEKTEEVKEDKEEEPQQQQEEEKKEEQPVEESKEEEKEETQED